MTRVSGNQNVGSLFTVHKSLSSMEFWLAPLHGITNYPFRNCLHRHVAGFNVAVTPFLAVQERSKLNVRKWLDVLPENNPDLEIIPQLIGNQPYDFGAAAVRLHAIQLEYRLSGSSGGAETAGLRTDALSRTCGSCCK